jgi:hypothetical protein
MPGWFRKKKEPTSQIKRRTPQQKAQAARRLEATGGAHLITSKTILPLDSAAQGTAPRAHEHQTVTQTDNASVKEKQERMNRPVQHANMPDPLMDRATRQRFNQEHNIIARLMTPPEEQFWLKRHDHGYDNGTSPSYHAHNLITAAHAGDNKKVAEYAALAVKAFKAKAESESALAQNHTASGASPELIQNFQESAKRSIQFANAYERLAKDPQQAIDAMEFLRKAAGK